MSILSGATRWRQQPSVNGGGSPTRTLSPPRSVGHHSDASTPLSPTRQILISHSPGIPGSVADMSVGMADDFGPDSPTGPVTSLLNAKEFIIVLDRTESPGLGIDVDKEDGETLLIQRIDHGRIEAWNQAHPLQMVRQGDRIVEINRVRGNVEKLLAEVKKIQQLTLKIQRDESTTLEGPSAAFEAAAEFMKRGHIDEASGQWGEGEDGEESLEMEVSRLREGIAAYRRSEGRMSRLVQKLQKEQKEKNDRIAFIEHELRTRDSRIAGLQDEIKNLKQVVGFSMPQSTQPVPVSSATTIPEGVESIKLTSPHVAPRQFDLTKDDSHRPAFVDGSESKAAVAPDDADAVVEAGVSPTSETAEEQGRGAKPTVDPSSVAMIAAAVAGVLGSTATTPVVKGTSPAEGLSAEAQAAASPPKATPVQPVQVPSLNLAGMPGLVAWKPPAILSPGGPTGLRSPLPAQTGAQMSPRVTNGVAGVLSPRPGGPAVVVARQAAGTGQQSPIRGVAWQAPPAAPGAGPTTSGAPTPKVVNRLVQGMMSPPIPSPRQSLPGVASTSQAQGGVQPASSASTRRMTSPTPQQMAPRISASPLMQSRTQSPGPMPAKGFASPAVPMGPTLASSAAAVLGGRPGAMSPFAGAPRGYAAPAGTRSMSPANAVHSATPMSPRGAARLPAGGGGKGTVVKL